MSSTRRSPSDGHVVTIVGIASADLKFPRTRILAATHLHPAGHVCRVAGCAMGAGTGPIEGHPVAADGHDRTARSCWSPGPGLSANRNGCHAPVHPLAGTDCSERSSNAAHACRRRFARPAHCLCERRESLLARALAVAGRLRSAGTGRDSSPVDPPGSDRKPRLGHVGAVAGVGVAVLLVRALCLGPSIPRLSELAVDANALAFALGARSLRAWFGVTPAVSVSGALRTAVRAAQPRRHRCHDTTSATAGHFGAGVCRHATSRLWLAHSQLSSAAAR